MFLKIFVMVLVSFY